MYVCKRKAYAKNIEDSHLLSRLQHDFSSVSRCSPELLTLTLTLALTLTKWRVLQSARTLVDNPHPNYFAAFFIHAVSYSLTHPFGAKTRTADYGDSIIYVLHIHFLIEHDLEEGELKDGGVKVQYIYISICVDVKEKCNIAVAVFICRNFSIIFSI